MGMIILVYIIRDIIVMMKCIIDLLIYFKRMLAFVKLIATEVSI